MSKNYWHIALFGVLYACYALADESVEERLQGDIGGFITAAQSPVRADPVRSLLLPYAYIDYGRAFIRIDTFGLKTLPLGYGHLEVVGRVKFDGFHAANNPMLKGIRSRQSSAPIGLGSFQLTPIGGFFVYAFRDVNRSKGQIYEASYATQFNTGQLTMYPQISVEHVSQRYTEYFYGISALEATQSSYPAYTPSAATNASLSVVVELPLAGGWISQFYLQRKRLDRTISASPLVDKRYLNSAYLTLAFRFE